MENPTFLSGESLDRLTANEKLGAHLFQEELSTKPRVKIAILDTGIDSAHPDLMKNTNTELSYDFLANASGSHDYNGHGTQMAGIIGGEINGA